MKSTGRLSATLLWKNGYCYRHEPTQEEWGQALHVREADLAWIDAHTTILPAEGPTDPPEELRRVNQAIGNNFIDDMLAAHGSDRLLLCQDQAYRALATQSLGLRASWLQPVLMVARDDGLLSRAEYDHAILSLIDFGDQVISIDSEVLVAATRQEEESPLGFDRVVSLLGGNRAEMLSHILVAVDFLGSICSEHRPELSTSKQTSLILENLIKRRTEWRGVIAILRRIYRERIGLDRELDKSILGWLNGHFLVSLEERSLPLADFGPGTSVERLSREALYSSSSSLALGVGPAARPPSD